jgi:hypothetical protein
MKKIVAILIPTLLTLISGADATTVIPPTFDQLVDRAEIILQGTVSDVKPQWTGEGAQRHIVTYVTFKVEDALKGTPGDTYTIRMFGGEIDGDGMAIADAPQFKVGDKDLVFIENNGSQLIPLVGMMFGRFHVRKNQVGQEMVTLDDAERLKAGAADGGESTSAAPAAGNGLGLAEFKSAVKKHLEESASRQSPQ